MIMIQIDDEILKLGEEVETKLASIFKKIDEVAMINSNRILSAFIDNQVQYSDFSDINGYGNYDTGREKLENIFSTILGMEDSLVRPQIMSGTNALYIAFSALLKYSDTLLSITGKPYDSLQEMIGISGTSTQSLKAQGVKFEQIDLINDQFDTETIIKRLKHSPVKVIEIQRSRGYSSRKSLTIDQIGEVIKEIRKVDTNVIIFVDNCYGELVETREPGHVGAEKIY
jgi:cystathionine beta-lyase family protein involved in aluminum resistance